MNTAGVIWKAPHLESYTTDVPQQLLASACASKEVTYPEQCPRNRSTQEPTTTTPPLTVT